MNITEQEKIRIKYAFLMKFTWQVIEADEQILQEEVDYFSEFFPLALVKALDLEEKEDRMRLYEQGVECLAKILTKEEKLEIIGVLVGASVSDGFMEFREFGIIEAASKVLEIPEDEFLAYFDYLFAKVFLH